MRRAGPIAAIAVVLVVSAFALARVAWNRSGTPDAEIVLTERELQLPEWMEEEDTGLVLRIAWAGAHEPQSAGASWFDQAKLESLGFDCRYPAEAPSAPGHYDRIMSRGVVLVLEYEGEAWRRWSTDRERDLAEKIAKLEDVFDASTREKQAAELRKDLEWTRNAAPRLFVVDAGLDPAELRRRYGDRSRYALARAVVSAHVPIEPESAEKQRKKPVLRGHVNFLDVGAINVPKGERALLDELVASDRRERKKTAHPAGEATKLSGVPSRTAPPRYQVRVRWGRRLEPWVVSVARTTETTPSPDGRDR